MKPIPDLDDDAAMIRRGRRSAIMSARNDACEALRDACSMCQTARLEDASAPAQAAIAAAERLILIANMAECESTK